MEGSLALLASMLINPKFLGEWHEGVWHCLHIAGSSQHEGFCGSHSCWRTPGWALGCGGLGAQVPLCSVEMLCGSRDGGSFIGTQGSASPMCPAEPFCSLGWDKSSPQINFSLFKHSADCRRKTCTFFPPRSLRNFQHVCVFSSPSRGGKN